MATPTTFFWLYLNFQCSLHLCLTVAIVWHCWCWEWLWISSRSEGPEDIKKIDTGDERSINEASSFHFSLNFPSIHKLESFRRLYLRSKDVSCVFEKLHCWVWWFSLTIRGQSSKSILCNIFKDRSRITIVQRPNAGQKLIVPFAFSSAARKPLTHKCVRIFPQEHWSQKKFHCECLFWQANYTENRIPNVKWIILQHPYCFI